MSRYRVTIEPWLAFLRHRVDSWVFQGQSVLQILAEVFADYAGQGSVGAAYRFDVADESVYPLLSTLGQFNETDHDFVSRLMADNGLFCWWEHAGQPGDIGTLGSHTLVIADHNSAVTLGAQERIRFTQTGASLKEDSLTQWHGRRRVGATQVTRTTRTRSSKYLPASRLSCKAWLGWRVKPSSTSNMSMASSASPRMRASALVWVRRVL